MNKKIADREVKVLASIAQNLQQEYPSKKAEWEGSPFQWILRQTSREKGAIIEKLAHQWCAHKGLDVQRCPDTQADRIIEGKRVEIKGSTLWKNGRYKFQQLRNQNYDVVLCIGISPFNVHCWAIPKAEIMHRWKVTGEIRPQHGGAKGADTAWLGINPQSPPDWLSPYGGRLSDVYRLLKR